MAFNNTVPLTLDISHDSGTNLITFVLTYYTQDSSGLYSVLNRTETINIPADVCSHNEVIGKVVTVQNDSQDEFEVTAGWYDVVNDTHYSDPGQELVDLIDEYIAMNTGGSSFLPAMTEAEAIVARTNSLLVPGIQPVILDGTSQGAAGDIVYLPVLNQNDFMTSGIAYRNEATWLANPRYLAVLGEFTASGWTMFQNDMNRQADATASYNAGTGMLTIGASLIGYGRLALTTSGASVLKDITGGVENTELEITCNGTDAILMDGSGNIRLIDGTEMNLTTDSTTLIRIRKVGSGWIELYRSF